MKYPLADEKLPYRSFPISIDFEKVCNDAQKPEVALEMERLKNQLGLGNEKIGIGIDRFDYTKGIPDRLKAFDTFLEKHPRYKVRWFSYKPELPVVPVLKPTSA